MEPGQVVEQGSPRSERDRLNRFAARAAALKGNADAKLLRLVPLLDELLRDGFSPIVYCRYIATANYVAEELGRRLKGYSADLRVLAVTGERSEEERETLIAELERSPRRLLVATDCLSEGINLQQAFDAVVHYDLLWNPNRLEQREGRVDRYGQPSKKVRTVMLYGQDNPIDEAVMKVLLRKAGSIHRTLGISVPLPLDSGTVVETLIASLFTPAPRQASMLDDFEQMALPDADQGLEQVEQAWNRAVEREKESRTRFAQRRIKPEEVSRELDETDAVLGDPAAVERFVRAACERLNATLTAERGHLLLSTDPLPQPIKERIAALLPQARKGRDAAVLPLTFADTGPQGVERIGRNHPLTAALAEYLLEIALTPESDTALAARCGLIRTGAVTKRTVLLQEYLNSTEHLWGIVANGERLRLLRDSSRFTRPAYVEFDLRAMFEGEKFSEFALLYRLIHRSRLPQDSTDASSCLLEKYHQQAVETGGRVREKLRDGVELALRTLGSSLLEHPANAALRAKLAEGRLTPLAYYRQLLKLIYRLLFLMVAEERGLIATGTRRLTAAEDDPFEIASVQSFDALLSSLVRGPSVSDRLRIYYNHYSVARLRRLAEQPGAGRGPYDDLWMGLQTTFRLLEGSDEQNPRSLGLAPLDGDLFGAEAIADLENQRLRNVDLLRAIRALSLYREKESKALRRVNYGALDVEELGSVYESLLDYRPVVSQQSAAAWPPRRASSTGSWSSRRRSTSAPRRQ